MVYQILISTMYLHFFNFFLVFMIVGLVGEAVAIAKDFRPLKPPLFLSPDNTIFLAVSPDRSYHFYMRHENNPQPERAPGKSSIVQG